MEEWTFLVSSVSTALQIGPEGMDEVYLNIETGPTVSYRDKANDCAKKGGMGQIPVRLAHFLFQLDA